MQGSVERNIGAFVFEGILQCEVEHTCGRCLKKVPETIRQEFRFFYDIKHTEVIDATDDIREVMLLKHPMSYLCPDVKTCKIPYLNDEKKGGSQDSAKKDHMTYKAFSSLKDIWQKKHKGERKDGTS
jgi:Predicted metal-binding, possibly nucleic acid-binding protein